MVNTLTFRKTTINTTLTTILSTCTQAIPFQPNSNPNPYPMNPEKNSTKIQPTTISISSMEVLIKKIIWREENWKEWKIIKEKYKTKIREALISSTEATVMQFIEIIAELLKIGTQQIDRTISHNRTPSTQLKENITTQSKNNFANSRKYKKKKKWEKMLKQLFLLLIITEKN